MHPRVGQSRAAPLLDFYMLCHVSQAVKAACPQTKGLELIERNCAINEGDPPDGKWHELRFTVGPLHVRAADLPTPMAHPSFGFALLLAVLSGFVHAQRKSRRGLAGALM